MRKPVLLALAGVLGVAAVTGGVLLWRHGQAAGRTGDEAQGGRLIPKVAAPDFALVGADGNSVSLGDLRGKYVVLFFSGGLNCLPCIGQISELNKDPALNNDGTVAFSVIPDPPSAWQQAQETSSSLAQARPLFDTEGTAFQAYESLKVSSLMTHGLHMSHTYFVINRQGMIVSVLDDGAMGVRNDVLAPLLGKIREIESGAP